MNDDDKDNDDTHTDVIKHTADTTDNDHGKFHNKKCQLTCQIYVPFFVRQIMKQQIRM